MDPHLLNIYGEFSVVTELALRNCYALPTLSNHKHIDLIVFCKTDKRPLFIQVKAKQMRVWPACSGINHQNSFLVFVDIKNRNISQKADYYILNLKAWDKLVQEKLKEYKQKHPNRRAVIQNHNLVLLDELKKNGKPYSGCSINLTDVEKFKDRWKTITDNIK